MKIIIQSGREMVVWGYFSNITVLLVGLAILPLVLTKLSIEELAIFFIMQTIIAMTSLIDVGFGPQLSKNITFILSGATSIKKKGIGKVVGNHINVDLLKLVIASTLVFYKKISYFSTLIVITLGWIYLTSMPAYEKLSTNILPVWLVFSASIFLNLRFAYLIPYLNAIGLIIECRKLNLLSKLGNFIVCFILLYFEMGLLSIAISNLLSSLINIFMAIIYLINNGGKKFVYIDQTNIKKKEISETLHTILNNAKLLGVYYLSDIFIKRGGILIGGVYLTTSDLTSFSLLLQLMLLVNTFSALLPTLLQTQIVSLRVENDKNKIRIIFGKCILSYLLLSFLGVLGIAFVGDWVLDFWGSSIVLPPFEFIIFFGILSIMDNQQQLFNSLISTKNVFPFVKSTLITSVISLILLFVVLSSLSSNYIWLAIIPGLCQLTYNNWYWPLYACRDLECSYGNLLLSPLLKKKHIKLK